MAENNFSCIKEIIQTVHIPLPSFYVGKETKGVSEVLDSWKRQYNHQLQGILVDYKNVSLKSDGSRSVVIDKPFVRYYVTATFELFCPSIGSIVKAKINRISHDYIGCLIHNTINATIKRFKKQPREINQFITLDNMILFQVTCFDFYRKSIRVKGEITEECLNLMKELPDFHMQSNAFESASGYLSTSEFSEDTLNSDVDKSNEKGDVHFEDDEELSPSLLSVNYTSLKNSNSVSNINIPNLDKEVTENTALFDTPSPSQDSNSSSSESNSQSINPSTSREKESKKRKPDGVVDKHELEPKKKKKHKDKKRKEKSSKRKGSSSKKSPKKKKKSKKEKLLQNKNLFADSDLLGKSIADGVNQEFSTADDDLTDASSQPSSTVTSAKKKDNKKLKHKLETKRKKSSKNQTSNALVKEEISTDSGYPLPSSKKKKSKESKSFMTKKSIGNVPQNTSLKQEESTDTSSQLSFSSEKKKHKKSKNISTSMSSENDTSNLFSINAGVGVFRIPNTSPSKKKKKSKPLTNTNEVSRDTVLERTPIKEEVHSDSVNNDFKSINYVLQNKLNTPKKENYSVFPYNSTEELMNAFSLYEPSLEDQLMHNETLTSNIKEKIGEIKEAKKRKRSSSDQSGQPKKKRRTEDEKSASKKNKDNLHKKKKAKKTEKEKSEKNSKKDKKKKLKDKPISKKKSLEYKIGLKKKEKLKDVKSRKEKKLKKDKSSHHEIKHVPSDVIKSENS